MRDPQSISGSTRARIRSTDVCMAMREGTECSTRACALTSRAIDQTRNSVPIGALPVLRICINTGKKAQRESFQLMNSIEPHLRII